MKSTITHPHQKFARTPLPIESTIRRRWSPRAFAPREVPDDVLMTLLEAARWAPSSYNEQPWRFIIAKREDRERFRTLLGCIEDGNRRWAARAPVLMVTAASTVFARTGEPNRHGLHDLGLAMGNLVNQATALGLYVHQMAGVRPDLAREAYSVPDEFEVVAGAAIGYLGDPDGLDDEERRHAETAERSRFSLARTVFEDTWGKSAELVADQTV